MSENKKTNKEEVVAPVAKADPDFPISTLRKDCLKLFGVTTSTFDGAMSGKDGTYTISAARGIIESWKKEVAR